MTAQYNPFKDVERFLNQMSRQLEEASGGLDPEEQMGRWSPGFESMAVDIVEQDGEFVVAADLPGFDRDDVDIRVTENRVHIEAEHREETAEEEDGRHIRHERRHRSLERSLTLPKEVDAAETEATMKHGVLTVTLPKRTVEDAHRIEIESE